MTILWILGFASLTLLICIISIRIHTFNNTYTEKKTLVVLKNELGPEWAGGTNNSFNLIKNVKEFEYYDKVSLIQIDTIVFGKILNSKIELSYSVGDDSDY